MERDNKGRFVSGHKPYKISGKRSKRVRKNISRGHVGVQAGEKNPMYGKRGEECPTWKGGKYTCPTNGYVMIWDSERQRYIGEHRLIVEKVLGRQLTSKEVVHHFNGKRDDNRPRNLLVCDSSYHHCLERKMAQLYKQEHFADSE